MLAQPDPKLVEQAQTGSIEAFDELLLLYQKPVYNYIYRLVNGRRDDAQDLTQDTFVKVYKHFDSYHREHTFTTWLFTIATNTVYDWFRKQKNKEFLLLDDDYHALETNELDPAYIIIDAKIDIEQAINRLKPIHRTVLLLYYYRGFSYPEIAQMLAIPLNTVKTHLSRAKKALRDDYTTI